MAATTISIITDKIWRALPPQVQMAWTVGNIESKLTIWLDMLRAEIADSPDAPKLQKTVSPTLTSGVASLTTSTDIDIAKIIRVEHSDATIGELQNARSWSYLRSPKNLNYNWYLVEAYSIHCRQKDGSTSTTNGTLSVLAPFQPVIAASAGSTTLPEDLTEDFATLAIRDILKQ